MSLMLDTSILIALERQHQKTTQLLYELKQKYPKTPKVSFMTYFEFVAGLRFKNEKNAQKAMAFIDVCDLVHTTKQTAHILTDFDDRYNLPLADLFIAAQAYEHRCILVTSDVHFARIKDIEKIII